MQLQQRQQPGPAASWLGPPADMRADEEAAKQREDFRRATREKDRMEAAIVRMKPVFAEGNAKPDEPQAGREPTAPAAADEPDEDEALDEQPTAKRKLHVAPATPPVDEVPAGEPWSGEEGDKDEADTAPPVDDKHVRWSDIDS